MSFSLIDGLIIQTPRTSKASRSRCTCTSPREIDIAASQVKCFHEPLPKVVKLISNIDWSFTVGGPGEKPVPAGWSI